MSEIRKSTKRSWGNSIKYGIAWGFLAVCLPRAIAALNVKWYYLYISPQTFYIIEAIIMGFAILVGVLATMAARSRPVKIIPLPQPETQEQSDSKEEPCDQPDQPKVINSSLLHLSFFVTETGRLFVNGVKVIFMFMVFGLVAALANLNFHGYPCRAAMNRDSILWLFSIFATIYMLFKKDSR